MLITSKTLTRPYGHATMARSSDARVVVTRHLVKAAKDSGMARQLYRSVDEMLFVSDAARQAFLAGHPGCGEDKLHVVHISIIPPELHEREESSDGTIRLLYIGKINRDNGVDVLVDAMAKLTDLPLHLTIAGVGPGKEVVPLMRACSNYRINDRVEWVGPIDDACRAIAKADIGVLPARVPEALGMTALDFISAGVPVVATATGGLSEIFTDGIDGQFVEPGNAEALAGAIRKLATDESLRSSIGLAARNTFETKLGYGQFFKKITALYEGAIRETK